MRDIINVSYFVTSRS